MSKIQTLVACLGLLWAPASLSALSIPEIVSKAKPAVLKITAYDSTGKPLRFGTGFFISDDGELVTNRHVIEDANTVTAETPSGASYTCEGVLLEPKDLDVVVLKFKARGVEKLVFGDASKITEGQKVVVIGNPEGLEGTISEGIIAAIRDNPHLIQITAPISPGSSGSPVLDEIGQVIGIATLVFKEGQNLNFAIPADEVTRALLSISKDTRVTPLSESQGANSQSGQVASDFQAIEDLEKQHKDSEALKLVAQFLKDHPADAKAWSVKARILAGLNLATEAVEAQKMAIKFDTDSAATWADMTFYLSVLAAGTPKPNGVESEIRSAAEHAIALGDDHEMTWDLLVWACGKLRDSTAAQKYARTKDERISRGELVLRTRALSDLIPGDSARIDLDSYASERSLTLSLEREELVIRGGRTELSVTVDTAHPNWSGAVTTGNAVLDIDVSPRKSKNGHWYIPEDIKTGVLEPILANPHLSTGPLKAYLAPLSTVVKRVDNGTNDLIREVIAQDPKSFAGFSAWKPMTPNAVVIFCSWDIQSREGPWPFFLTKLLPQAPVSEFRSREVVDRDFQESALLQISFQNALPEKGWAHAGLMELDKTVSSFPIKPDCPTILCSIKLNPEASSAEIKRATNDVKTFFVKALNDFNSQLAEIAAARNKNAAPGNRAATK